MHTGVHTGLVMDDAEQHCDKLAAYTAREPFVWADFIAVADQEAAVDFERTQRLHLNLGAGKTQRSTEALQRSPQAFSMALRSCLPGRPCCRLSAGSVPMRRWSAASARAFRLSAVSR